MYPATTILAKARSVELDERPRRLASSQTTNREATLRRRSRAPGLRRRIVRPRLGA